MPGAQWLTSQAGWVNSRLKVRLSEKVKTMIVEDTQFQPLASTYIPVHIYPSRYTQEHTDRQSRDQGPARGGERTTDRQTDRQRLIYHEPFSDSLNNPYHQENH